MTLPVARLKRLRVLHLVGSAESDFLADLSRLYARDALRATADPATYQPLLAYVSPDGSWRFPADLDDDAIAAAEAVPLGEALGRLAAAAIDVMVPQMFCRAGMTHYRALFDVLGVPYVGNTAEVMALATDKAKARAVVAHAGVRVPHGEVLSQDAGASLNPPFPYPVVVKPVDADNSVGVSLVRDRSEYAAALETAWTQGGRALVETYVDLGREVRCGVLGRDGRLVCLPLEEYAVDPVGKPIRDRSDKLARGSDDELFLVAKDATRARLLDPDGPDAPLTTRVWEAARRCHVALGCRHYSLFDFRIDPDGEPWFLEAGLYCSYAEKSVVSVMARAAGISVPDLFASGVELALSGRSAVTSA